MPKETTDKIKLSPKQKEVILAMRENENLLKWISIPICKFTFRGKTLRYDLAFDLKIKGLIGGVGKGLGDYYHTLTELGKTLPLE